MSWYVQPSGASWGSYCLQWRRALAVSDSALLPRFLCVHRQRGMQWKHRREIGRRNGESSFNSRFFPDFTCGRDYHRQDHSPHQQLWWIKGAGPCCFCWGEVKRFCTGWHFSGAHRLLRSLTSAANLHARIQATYSAQPKTSAPATFSIPPAGQFSFKHLKKKMHLAVGKRTNPRNLNLYLCLCLYLYRQKRQKKT